MDLNRDIAKRQAERFGQYAPNLVNKTLLTAMLKEEGLIPSSHCKQDGKLPEFWKANSNCSGCNQNMEDSVCGNNCSYVAQDPNDPLFGGVGQRMEFAKQKADASNYHRENSLRIDIDNPEYIDLMNHQDQVKQDKLLVADRWKHPIDTEWHILRLKNKFEVDRVKTLLQELRKKNKDKEDEEEKEEEVQVIKLLTLRYEEPENERAFKNAKKCEEMDKRNASRFLVNSKLADIVSHNILLPLYQKPQKVPVPLEYGPIAKERWAAYCSSPAVQLKQAVRYLHQRGKLAQKDYKINRAIELANDLAFKEAIEQEILRYKATERDGMVPVRIRGQRPARWNGRDETDSRGVYIRWVRRKGFSFIRNDLIDIEHYNPSETTTPVVVLSSNQ